MFVAGLDVSYKSKKNTKISLFQSKEIKIEYYWIAKNHKNEPVTIFVWPTGRVCRNELRFIQTNHYWKHQ